MPIKEDIRPISYVKAHTADVISQVNLTHRPIFVTQNGEAMAVVIDTESYEKIKKTIGLLKIISQGEKDIADGKYQPQEDFFAVMDKRVSQLKHEK